jgi:hypothetical protein
MFRHALRILRPAAAALAAALLLACAGTGQEDWLAQGRNALGSMGGSSALSSSEIGAGLKEALEVGTSNVVAQLGQSGGFSADPAIHIPLPESLAGVQSALGAIGLSGMLDDLEARLNSAAEVATPKAKALFVDAIRSMTLDDVRGIYTGPDDAATRYFQGKMSASLAQEMTPIVNSSLADVGAVKAYDEVMGRYEALPFMPDAKANLTTYVVEQGMGGIFHYLAKEEAAIRRDPAQRTTELLRRVFGAN